MGVIMLFFLSLRAVVTGVSLDLEGTLVRERGAERVVLPLPGADGTLEVSYVANLKLPLSISLPHVIAIQKVVHGSLIG